MAVAVCASRGRRCLEQWRGHPAGGAATTTAHWYWISGRFCGVRIRGHSEGYDAGYAGVVVDWRQQQPYGKMAACPRWSTVVDNSGERAHLRGAVPRHPVAARREGRCAAWCSRAAAARGTSGRVRVTSNGVDSARLWLPRARSWVQAGRVLGLGQCAGGSGVVSDARGSFGLLRSAGADGSAG